VDTLLHRLSPRARSGAFADCEAKAGTERATGWRISGWTVSAISMGWWRCGKRAWLGFCRMMASDRLRAVT